MPGVRGSRLRTVGLRLAVGAVLGGAVALGYAHAVETEWLRVRRIELFLPHLAPAFDGYRVAHLSDLHISEWLSDELLAGVARLTNEQEPDLIALTGDYADHPRSPYAHRLVPFLQALRPRDATVGVLGNHDHYANPSVIGEMLDLGGVSRLDNDTFGVRRGDSVLTVAGVDDTLFGLDRMPQVLDRLPEDGGTLLLAHEPDYADLAAATGRFALQLSGHTHGGQVQAPLIGPLLLPRHGHKYPYGLYKVNGMYLYTHPGVGMGKIHVRVLCRPEVTVFTLRSGERP